MSDTPRTDAVIAALPPVGFYKYAATEAEIKLARLCGDLERELAAADARAAKRTAQECVEICEGRYENPRNDEAPLVWRRAVEAIKERYGLADAARAEGK